MGNILRLQLKGKMMENNVIIYRYLQKCVENANEASYNKFIEGSKPLESVHT